MVFGIPYSLVLLKLIVMLVILVQVISVGFASVIKDCNGSWQMGCLGMIESNSIL